MTTTIEETLEKSRRLGRFLDEVTGRTAKMPETGASKMASDLIDGLMAKVGKEMDAVRLDLAAATTSLVTEIRGGSDVARAIRAEAMTVRSKWAAVLGNAEQAADESKTAANAAHPPPGKT